MAKNDYTIRNSSGKVVGIAPDETVWRYLRDCLPDGDYSVKGPDTDCTIYRINGVVYPASGVVRGCSVPTRSREECLADPEYRL